MSTRSLTKERQRLREAQEELELIEVANGRTPGDEQAAKETLLARHDRIMKHLARRVVHAVELPMEDAMQEAAIGLLRAIYLFNPAEGVRLATYATPHILQRMKRARQQQGSLIRLPVNVYDALTSLRKRITFVHKKLGRTPTAEEAAEFLDLPLSLVERVLSVPQSPLSLDERVHSNKGNDGETVFRGDIIPHPVNDLDDFLHLWICRDECEELLAMIPNSRDRDIFRRRFGLPPYPEEQTFEQISGETGVPRSTAQQIVERTQKMLRVRVGTDPADDLPTRFRTEERNTELVQLARDGWRVVELATLFQLTAGRVSQILKEAQCRTTASR